MQASYAAKPIANSAVTWYIHVYCIHAAAANVNAPWQVTSLGTTIANINHTSLITYHNLDSTNLDDSVAIATPVSQRSGSFTE